MNHEHTTQHGAGETPIDEQTLMMAADGELGPDEMARVESAASSDPSIASRLEHERRLLEAVGRALGADESVPDGLRTRIAGAMAAVRNEELEDAPPADVLTTPMGDTRQRDFWTKVPSVLAVAATLALVASVLIVSFSMGRPLYRDGQLGTYVVGYIQNEHLSCAAFGERFDRKFVARSLDAAREAADRHMGDAVNALTMDPQTWSSVSLEFAGFGPCALPGVPKSGHIMLRHAEDPGVVVSLFVAPDDGSLAFASSNCCYVNEPESDDGSIVVWRLEGIVYFLYSPDEAALASARGLFGTPENERPLL